VPAYHLLNVFTAEDGSYGNPLGVFLDGAGYSDSERQAIAADLGYSETVFVEDVASGRIRIFTPADELPLAGHPTVGTAWLIAREYGACDVLRPPAGEVPTWQNGDVRWFRARPEWAPRLTLRQYDTPDQVDALDGAPEGLGFADCWSWIDEDAGLVRARVFVPDHGIEEDEATGVATLPLVAHVGRAVEVHQGEGSVLYARPGPDGTVEVGGRVVYRGERPYDG
jgi:predicted PhzF superfamily epimerase YddE/YHI9